MAEEQRFLNIEQKLQSHSNYLDRLDETLTKVDTTLSKLEAFMHQNRSSLDAVGDHERRIQQLEVESAFMKGLGAASSVVGFIVLVVKFLL